MVSCFRHAERVRCTDKAGTMIDKEDIAAVKAPVSMVCIEDDSLFPDEVREAGKEALDKSGVEHEVEVYSGVPHGESESPNGLLTRQR